MYWHFYNNLQVSLPHKIGSSPNNSKNLISDNAKMTGNYWSPAVICSPVNDISRMQNFLPAGKKIIIFKYFIESQFKYWTLTWMFCSQKGNNIINSLHERYLRTVNNDYESHMRNFFLIIAIFLFMTRIYTVWVMKYTNLLMICQWEISKSCLI